MGLSKKCSSHNRHKLLHNLDKSLSIDIYYIKEGKEILPLYFIGFFKVLVHPAAAAVPFFIPKYFLP